MDNEKIIIIGIIVLIIAAGIILVMLTSADYDKIEVTPNGTTIEVPGDNQTKYDGEIESAKIWHWDNGILVTYNSNADKDIIKVTELGYDTLNDLIKNGEQQNIDGFTCYVINADQLLEVHLFDVIKVNYNGKFYCIPLANETTHDNILICCNDRDTAVHMAKSVQYKNVYPDDGNLHISITGTDNITDDLLSKANNTNLTEVKSTVEEKTGVNLDDAKTEIEQYTGKLPISIKLGNV